ncbi:MAG: hypothetical protein QM500_15605 [Methylococcales bacterium]
MREIPNKNSNILKNSIVAGAGLTVPPNITPPEDMAAIILYVPSNLISGKNPIEIQNDLGLPWIADDTNGIWLEDLMNKK